MEEEVTAATQVAASTSISATIVNNTNKKPQIMTLLSCPPLTPPFEGVGGVSGNVNNVNNDSNDSNSMDESETHRDMSNDHSHENVATASATASTTTDTVGDDDTVVLHVGDNQARVQPGLTLNDGDAVVTTAANGFDTGSGCGSGIEDTSRMLTDPSTVPSLTTTAPTSDDDNGNDCAMMVHTNHTTTTTSPTATQDIHGNIQ